MSRKRTMRYSTQWISVLLAVVSVVIIDPSRVGAALPGGIEDNEIVFVYVHGFGEVRADPPFEVKMREFLEDVSVPAAVFNYRWDSERIDLTKVVHQWSQAKKKADRQARRFSEDVILPLEAAGIPYFIVGYSLGTRVVAESFTHIESPLEHLGGVYFLGAALPHTYQPDTGALPEGMKVMSYYSPLFDQVLNISFYNAEGVEAGGKIGFDDQESFRQYRTACTHIHKGGPVQRDFSNLAPAIGYIAFFKSSIYLEGRSPYFNLGMPVASGELNWNDIVSFETVTPPILIQQNVNTGHYRAVALREGGRRVRRAWGTNLHTILRELHLFSP